MSRRVLGIVGPTGVGKSKLAVDIAKFFGGRAEIISADSIQVYKGFTIGSGRVTKEEMMGIPHHLLSIQDANKPYSIRNFLPVAVRLVDEIWKRENLPIIVGGTFFYLESLLLKNWMTENMLNQRCVDGDEEDREFLWGSPVPISNTGLSLWERLFKVDPDAACFFHPNDHRKILRSLQIYEQNGSPSSVIKDAIGYSSRYPGSSVLWIDADPDILSSRIFKRVDDMIKRGLLEEVLDLDSYLRGYPEYAEYLKEGRGIFKALGFKELIPWATEVRERPDNQTKVEKLRLEGIETVKMRTKRYAKRQLGWLRNRFGNEDRFAPLISLTHLDSSNYDMWESSVLKPALRVAQRVQNGDALPGKNEAIEEPKSIIFSSTKDSQRRRCWVCDGFVLTGKKDWEVHQKSNRHKKAVKRKNWASNRIEILEEKDDLAL